MLKRLGKYLNAGRFSKNEKGSVKIMAALTTPMLLLMAGAGIDTAELYRARINFQSAVDAAALTAAKTLASTGNTTQASQAGEEVFYGNIRNIAADIADASVSFDMGNGDCSSAPIVANATLKKSVYFASIRAATFKGDTVIDSTKKATDDEKRVTLYGTSEVQCGNNTIEVAMVLDNSGSMNSSGKIATLRSAASNLVNTLHTTMGSTPVVDPLKFSLVPFSAMVNVGSNYKSAGWMDTTGVSDIHHENLKWSGMDGVTQVGRVWQDQNGLPLTRFSLYDQLPGISWKGCVEARPYPHHIQDTTPSVGDPNSMFVPTFAPDTPDNWTGDYEQTIGNNTQATCSQWQGSWRWTPWGWRRRSVRRCTHWSDGQNGPRHPQNWGYRPHWDDRIEYQLGSFMGGGGGSGWVNGNPIYEETYQNNYLEDDHNFPAGLSAAGEHPKSAANTGTSTDPDTGQWGRQKWAWKYFNNPDPKNVNNGSSNLPSVAGYEGGPNAWCRSQPLTDLTTSQSDVIDAISTMTATGTTNIQAGVAWGWRTLSPGEPFTNGRDYNAPDNKKVMIVMTDGNNTAYPIDLFYSGYSKNNKSYYDTFGHSANERIFDGFDQIANPSHSYSTFRQAMDSHLVKTCANVKAAGIQVYTIAFDVANGSSVKTMLEECASQQVGGGRLYFDADNNAELIATFQSIAEDLADLAIVK